MAGKYKDIIMVHIQEHVSLKPYTVFKIGGPARYFCEIQTTKELRDAMQWAKERNAPFVVLGAGSNVLVSDEGCPGLVIHMQMRGMEKIEDTILRFDAGVSMAAAVHFALSCGLGGFEWAIGIPGTIGGSVFGNAGCFGGEMKDVVESIDVFNTSTMALQHYSNTACNFSYRHSIFKEYPEWIIVNATLKLPPLDSAHGAALVREYGKQRVTTQDIGSQCAGCIFKNPARSDDWVTPSDGGAKIPAGQLIDEAGLKGTKVGGATVSLKHGNFIVNTGNATASDVRQLIAFIKEKVKSVYDIELEEEIRYIG